MPHSETYSTTARIREARLRPGLRGPFLYLRLEFPSGWVHYMPIRSDVTNRTRLLISHARRSEKMPRSREFAALNRALRTIKNHTINITYRLNYHHATQTPFLISTAPATDADIRAAFPLEEDL